MMRVMPLNVGHTMITVTIHMNMKVRRTMKPIEIINFFLAEAQRPEAEDIASLGSANHPATDPSDLISRSSRLDYNDHNTGGASHRTCKPADVNRHKNSTGDRVLSDVASELKATEKTSDVISQELAISIDDLMFKKEKIDEEKIIEKLAKILRPNNCHSLITTKVDDLMWRSLQTRTKTFDYKLQLVQSQIIKGVTILSKTSDSVLKLKASIGQGKPNQSTPSNSNVSDDNSSATQENSTYILLTQIIQCGLFSIMS
ncbi:hypothetical protein SNE40_021222 [Patella caerulea]|uniref:Uncharacterized protein n=1 Tax=Patella caerulea TaxID=87958 RepID=A0AAN8G3J8_PATCE